jgi:hypothetical protein
MGSSPVFKQVMFILWTPTWGDQPAKKTTMANPGNDTGKRLSGVHPTSEPARAMLRSGAEDKV